MRNHSEFLCAMSKQKDIVGLLHDEEHLSSECVTSAHCMTEITQTRYMINKVTLSCWQTKYYDATLFLQLQ